MTRRLSIRTRLTVIASVAVTATALLVCSLAWLAVRHALVHQIDQQLRTLANGPVRQFDPGTIAAIPSTPRAVTWPIFAVAGANGIAT